MGKGAHRDRDKYYFLAKEQGYRARSAFKLIQLNKKYDFLARANVLIDLCAAPGGWLQVASKYMPVSSMIIGVDLVPIRPIPNVITHAEDILTAKCRTVLKKDMGKHKADVVLHDGAPNVGAAWIKDAYGQAELVLHSLKLATEFLKRNGWFVTKVFRSADYHSLLWVFQQLFKKVEATKPHSSRNASAEIFVVCQGYLAPDRIDPKFLSPEYVFKQLDSVKKPVNVLHGKVKQKRNREGYDESLGQVLHTKTSVARFIDGEDPTHVLSTAHQLVFDADSEQYKTHKATTAEVVACCADLRVLGKRDFRGLLKWRALIRRDLKAQKQAEEEAAAAAAESDEEKTPAKTPEEQAAYEEAMIDVELEDLSAEAKKRAKRLRKKQRAAHQKQLRRVALGMSKQAVDLVQDPNLFTLKTFKDAQELEEAAEVNLSKPSKAVARAIAAGGEMSSDSESDVAEPSDLDSDEEAARYQEKLEDEMAAFYDSKQKRSAERTLEAAGDVKSGVRLTRKQRAIEEAKIREAEAMAKMDSQHQAYLRLLAKAGKRADDSDDDSGSSSDDGFDDDPDAPSASNPLIARPAHVSSDDEDTANAQADARADRWFSQSMFQDAEEDVLAETVAAARAMSDSDASSDAEDSAAESDDDAVEVEEPVEKKKTRRGKRRNKQAEEDDVERDASGKVVLEPMPMTEREKRKQKHRKQRAKKEARMARKRARERDFEVVAEEDSDDNQMNANDEDLTPKQKADRAQKRELIKAGMGRALTGKEDGEFEIVAAPDSDVENNSEGAYDPRDEDYDSDTHAELLALAKKMRRHTTAKALVDASYNRYSFNDDYLPQWFLKDERQHFQPQLPITKAEVDQIKANFRDIVSRPVAKVAEARARKRRRLMKNLEKAKQQARTIAASEDLSAQGKARAIQKAFKRAELKKQATSYVVYRNGRQISSTSAGKGSKVKMVDPRLKADTRGMKRTEARRAGRVGKGRKGRKRSGRRKR